MKKNVFQEQLAALYLRLNGYFVSGFIVHAPEEDINKEGNPLTVRSELDMLAVRFPYNAEPERVVGPAEYLKVTQDCIDILICEVKGGRKQPLQFNESLRLNDAAILTVLRWIGILPEDEVKKLVPTVRDMLSVDCKDSPDSFRQPVVPSPNYRIRAIFFAPDRKPPMQPNQARYIHGKEMIGYIWECLRPDKKRKTCRTDYEPLPWGYYETIVRCFKKAEKQFGSMQELYEAVQKMEQEASGSSTTNSGV